MYHTKKIGVFISHIYGDYQSMLCSGIIEKASDYGYLVEIFTSNDGEDLGEYGKGEFSIINIPRPGNYAGIIIASGTYLLKTLEEDIFKMLQEHFTCPIIDLSQNPSIYPRVVLENNRPVKDLVLHLGKHHHYKHICYLGSSIESNYNFWREQAFIDGLKELSLPVEDNIISSSDFSPEGIEQALNQLLLPDTAPDAIVCYNDRIALTVISILKSRGYQIPEQIAVTGCDTLTFGQMTAPKLTSVTFPINEIGKMAVEQLTRLIRQEAVAPVTTISAAPSIGASCGCSNNPPFSSNFYARRLYEHIANMEQNQILNMHMSVNLQGVNDLDQGIKLIAQYTKNLPDCKEFYLCLYEDWDKVSSHIREITFTEEDEHSSDTVLLKLAIKDGKQLPECTFAKHNILPDYLYDGNTAAYIYTPLFFGEKSFGYLALSFYNSTVGYSFLFLSWLMNVNSMFKSLCDKKNMGLLMERLEDIYTRDELTGLLNRQGFKLLSVPAFEKAISEKTPVCAFMFDLDCLKLINDTFGHAEGDFSIQVLAHALENSVEEGQICARQGGDEFQVLAFGYTHEKASLLVENVNKYLSNYNKLHTKDYHIQTSSGYCLRIPETPDELKEMYKEADQNMYEHKRNKVKQVIKESVKPSL